MHFKYLIFFYQKNFRFKKQKSVREDNKAKKERNKIQLKTKISLLAGIVSDSKYSMDDKRTLARVAHSAIFGSEIEYRLKRRFK